MIDRPFRDPATASSESIFEHAATTADVELVEATRAYLACLESGDDPGPMLTSAWDQFYRTYAPIVVRLARHRCPATGDPDDGAQDVWQAIVAGLVTFRPDPACGPFQAWLLVVARRRLADQWRSDARKIHPVIWDTPPDHLEGIEPDPAITCERNDERAYAANLLIKLQDQASSLSYRILHLRAIEGRTVPEVARLVGLTAGQVRVRHHRMLAKLRRLAGVVKTGGSTSIKEKLEKFPPTAQQRRVGRRVYLVEGTAPTINPIAD